MKDMDEDVEDDMEEDTDDDEEEQGKGNLIHSPAVGDRACASHTCTRTDSP